MKSVSHYVVIEISRVINMGVWGYVIMLVVSPVIHMGDNGDVENS